MATADEQKDQHTKQESFAGKVWIASAIVALVVIVLLLFKVLFSVILLTFAGLLVAVFFHGFGDLIQRNLHLSRTLSVVLSVIVTLLLAVAFFWFVGGRLSQQVSDLSNTLPQTIEHAKSQLSQSALGQKLLNQLQSSSSNEKLKSVARQLFSSAYGALSDLYIILLLSLFFTVSPTLYKRGVVHLLPPNAKHKGDELLGKFYTVLKKWLKSKIVGTFFIAIITGAGLLIIDFPLVLTLALIAGILNFIPNFGPLIALIPAVLLALLQGTSTVLVIICLYTGVQIVQSAILQPLVQQKMVNMPPALIIISQLAMGTLGGFWGILLATPTVLVIMTLLNELYVKPQPYHKYKMK